MFGGCTKMYEVFHATFTEKTMIGGKAYKHIYSCDYRPVDGRFRTMKLDENGSLVVEQNINGLHTLTAIPAENVLITTAGWMSYDDDPRSFIEKYGLVGKELSKFSSKTPIGMMTGWCASRGINWWKNINVNQLLEDANGHVIAELKHGDHAKYCYIIPKSNVASAY
jgi:hypothetical protein